MSLRSKNITICCYKNFNFRFMEPADLLIVPVNLCPYYKAVGFEVQNLHKLALLKSLRIGQSRTRICHYLKKLLAVNMTTDWFNFQ